MPNYHSDLRQLVGHRPLIMVGATVLLFNQQNELLLIKRTDNKLWGVPGGGLELGESLEECARRETLEETGVLIKELTFFGNYSGKDFHYTYPNEDEVYMVTAVYRAQTNSVMVTLSHEHDAYQFTALQNIPEDISPTIKPILCDLILKYKE